MKEQNKMKKLMIAAAIVCAAAMSQAATVNWKSTTAVGSVVAANVVDNGVYANNGANSKSFTSLAVTLALYDGATLIGSATVDPLKYGASGGKASSSFDIAAATEGSTYSYVLTISGTDNNLTGRGAEAAYDYSNAKISQELKGSVTLNTMGATSLSANTGAWTVSGIVAAPEPTSGLLLLLGVAGLALKRKQK